MRRHSHRRILSFGLVLILVLVMIFSGLRILESTVFYNGSVIEETHVSKTITRDGVAYFPRQDITVIMALGIDEKGPVVSSGDYRNNGEADAIFLIILDQVDETYSVLCLNRDTMLEIPVIGLGGKKAGTYYGQLALSHTYGEGLEDSCENSRETISNFLYGITIDHYIAMNMDAISILNDAVGGVTVNVVDDFSKVDPRITKGEHTLMGSEALSFVQTRKDLGDQLNISRMVRHREYMQGFMKAFVEKVESSDTFVLKLHDKVSEYVVTDCSATVISGIMDRCADYSLKEIVSVEGDNVLGEEYYEFYPNEEKLDELILRLFYAPKH